MRGIVGVKAAFSRHGRHDSKCLCCTVVQMEKSMVPRGEGTLVGATSLLGFGRWDSVRRGRSGPWMRARVLCSGPVAVGKAETVEVVEEAL